MNFCSRSLTLFSTSAHNDRLKCEGAKGSEASEKKAVNAWFHFMPTNPAQGI